MYAPPPAEFCILWIDHWSTCLQKGEWASWVQAIGSLFALGIAIYVGGGPGRAAKEQAQGAAVAFALSYHDVMNRIMYGIAAENGAVIHAGAAKLRETVDIGKAVPLHAFDSPMLSALLDLRLCAAESLSFLDAHFKSVPNRLADLEIALERLSPDANIALRVVCHAFRIPGPPMQIRTADEAMVEQLSPHV